MKRIALYLGVGLTIIACKKDEPTTPGNPPSSFGVTFSGFTTTDQNGQVIGSADVTDWTFDTDWSTTERLLFPTFGSLSNVNTASTSVAITPAYANPATDAFFNYITKDNDTRIMLRLVEENGTVLFTADSVYANNFAVTLSPFNLTSGDLIRLYYLMERNDSIIYKGHGDIKIN